MAQSPKVSIERLKDKVEGAKRQYAPFRMCWICPDCKAKNGKDFSSDYFGYPVFGEPQLLDLLCTKCEQEDRPYEKGQVKVVLDLTFRVVSPFQEIVDRAGPPPFSMAMTEPPETKT